MLSHQKLRSEGYFDSMNAADLEARKVNSRDHALHSFLQNCRPPTPIENKVLEQATSQADNLLKSFPKLVAIPWRIFIVNDHIESGFPHTHQDAIILPKSHVTTGSRRPSALVETLIHEKVHVFQRQNPCQTNILYVNYYGFTIDSRRLPSLTDTLRSNPDVNMLVYKDEHGFPIQLYYKNDSTNSNITLSKTKGDPRDHPHEIMAYTITHIVTQGKSRLEPYHTRYIESTLLWMNKYLT